MKKLQNFNKGNLIKLSILSVYIYYIKKQNKKNTVEIGYNDMFTSEEFRASTSYPIGHGFETQLSHT